MDRPTSRRRRQQCLLPESPRNRSYRVDIENDKTVDIIAPARFPVPLPNCPKKVSTAADAFPNQNARVNAVSN
jgi:hypothetical protein